MKKETLYLIAQIISAIEATVIKLEEAYENRNAKDFEKCKRTILEFQKKLDQELT